MDLQEYISSGIIESYVIGLTSEKENEELEKLAGLHPEIRSEVQANQIALENYISLYKHEPLITTKDKIFEQINMEKQTISEKFKDKVSFSPFRIWWVAASFLLLAVSLLYNLFLYRSLREKEGLLAQLHNQNKRLSMDNLINKANYRNASEQLSLIHKHGNKTTHLEGLGIAKDASAMIYWNSESKDVYLSIDYLPKPPAGKQYQLWAIEGGKPVSAGVIDLYFKENALVKMNNTEKAQAFAISLENKGGANVPTMEAIYVMGTI